LHGLSFENPQVSQIAPRYLIQHWHFRYNCVFLGGSTFFFAFYCFATLSTPVEGQVNSRDASCLLHRNFPETCRTPLTSLLGLTCPSSSPFHTVICRCLGRGNFCWDTLCCYSWICCTVLSSLSVCMPSSAGVCACMCEGCARPLSAVCQDPGCLILAGPFPLFSPLEPLLADVRKESC